jgi:2OG-Fe(II) oxygenase superfamily
MERMRDRYLAARPFPYLVIENLFPAPWLRAILDDYGDGDGLHWKSYNTALQKKKGTEPNSDLPCNIQRYFDFVNSGPFLRLLTGLTGIDHLLPDPTLYGGGLHVVSGEGHFDMHVDFQKHPRTHLNNRLALLTYLNDDWDSAHGGDLELWTMRPPARAVAIVPHFGRTVLMEQSAIAAHGHPAQVRPGLERKAVIAYFYTNGTASSVPRDGQARSTTVYIPRPGQSASARLQTTLHNVLPPRAVGVLQKLRRTMRGQRES